MTPPIHIEDDKPTSMSNAAVPPAICFSISTAEYAGKNSPGDFYFQIKNSKIVAEGSALVASRRNEQTKPLRQILEGGK